MDFQERYIENDLHIKDTHNSALEIAISKLKERDVKIVLLHLIEGYSLKEIATHLDINYNTTYSIYTRAVEKIKTEMEDKNNEF